VSEARRVITLITPFTAFAPHNVAPGPLMTSMRSTSSSNTSWASPENAGEKRRIDGAAVDEDQQLVGDGVV